MGRIVAIDFGEKKIGLAVSDLSKQISFPFKTILAEKNFELTAKAVLTHLKEKEPLEAFVVGLPLHMDGKPSPMSEKAKAFGEVLAQVSGLKVVYFDERLSSKQVDVRLKEHQINRKKRAEASDVLAAQLILESYLNQIF